MRSAEQKLFYRYEETGVQKILRGRERLGVIGGVGLRRARGE